MKKEKKPTGKQTSIRSFFSPPSSQTVLKNVKENEQEITRLANPSKRIAPDSEEEEEDLPTCNPI